MEEENANLIYLCWLIPSIVSFIFISFLIIDILRSKNFGFYGVKTLAYCVAEIIVCSSVSMFLLIIRSAIIVLNFVFVFQFFIAQKYKTDKHTCVIQERMFLTGMMFKGFISGYSSTVLLSVVKYKAIPSWNSLKFHTILSVCVVIMFLALLFLLQATDIICGDLHRDDFFNHPGQTSMQLWAYLLCFIVPMFVMLGISTVAGYMALKVSEEDNITTAALLQLTDRLRIYPVIYTIGIGPTFIFLVVVAFGHVNTVLYCLTALTAGSTGLMVSIYMFLLPYLDKLRRINIQVIADALMSTFHEPRPSQIPLVDRESGSTFATMSTL
jgi:hypothetical protein